MGLFFGSGRSRLRSVLSYIPLVRWIGPGITTAVVMAAVGAVLTGRIDLGALDFYRGSEPALTARPVNLKQLGEKNDKFIRVATFNIQVFGDKKSTDAEVMPTLAQVVASFDVVAIQEVRTGSAVPVERLVQLINASGGQYAATVSKPIGRTSQTECYAFVWDESRIEFVPDSGYVIRDEADRMHREPMVASFRARTQPLDGRRPFSFTMINVHTDPDEVGVNDPESELNVLDDVFVRVRDYEYGASGEEDFLLLGDLNVDTAGLNELGQIRDVVSVAGDIMTTTRRTKTYDHILLDRRMSREFTGRFGVVDFIKDLGLSEEAALNVSDHLPVWAEFSAYETPSFPPAVATAETPIKPQQR